MTKSEVRAGYKARECADSGRIVLKHEGEQVEKEDDIEEVDDSVEEVFEQLVVRLFKTRDPDTVEFDVVLEVKVVNVVRSKKSDNTGEPDIKEDLDAQAEGDGEGDEDEEGGETSEDKSTRTRALGVG